MEETLFHITTAADWAVAVRAGSYDGSTRGATLADVGFIHCSFDSQVSRVANALYHDIDEPLVLLQIDPAGVSATIRVENLDGGHEAFPHVYGRLDVSAVTAVFALERMPSGEFERPAAIGSPEPTK